MQQAHSTGETEQVQRLQHAWSQLQQLQQSRMMSSLPDDLVSQCVAGLKGHAQDKLKLFNDLETLSHQHHDAVDFVKVVQQALFMSSPLQVDSSSLTGSYAELWQNILAQFNQV